jgi:hypothetical protein
MTFDEHKEIHVKLHKSLIELVEDFYQVTKTPLETLSLKDFFGWSLSQTLNPQSASIVEDTLKQIQSSIKEEERGSLNGRENENIPISQSQTNSTTPEGKHKRKVKA